MLFANIFPYNLNLNLFLQVTDLAGDGTSGYPTIKEGGLNYNHVTIHMKSKINHGLFFRITILGEPAYLKPNVTDNYSE